MSFQLNPLPGACIARRYPLATNQRIPKVQTMAVVGIYYSVACDSEEEAMLIAVP